MLSPREEILEAITAEEYYKAHFTDITFDASGQSTQNVHCFVHDDQEASMSVHLTDGGKCHGCGVKWSDPIWFTYYWEKHVNGRKRGIDAIVKQMYHSYVHPLVHPKIVRGWHTNLLKVSSLRKRLREERHVLIPDIEKYQLGHDPDDNAFTIPIHNQEGWIIDVRKLMIDLPSGNKFKNRPYDWQTAKEKRLRGEKTHGQGGRVFPRSKLSSPVLTICEGEWDAILLNKAGITAVTAGSVNDWDKKLHLLRGKDISIMFDNDTKKKGSNPGQEAALKLKKKLYPIVKSVRNVVLPNGDVCDYFIGGGTAEGLHEMFQGSTVNVPKDEVEAPETDPLVEIPSIVDLIRGDFYGKRVMVSGRVVGEKEEFYSLPTKWALECGTDQNDKCLECPMMAHQGVLEGNLPPTDDLSLMFMDVPDDKLVSHFCKENRISPRCRSIRFKRREVYTLQPVSISPTMERDFKKADVDRLSVLSSCGKLDLNSEYNFIGRITHDPRNQKTLFIVEDAEVKEMSFRDFQIPGKEKRKDLHKKFTPTQVTKTSILKKHEELMKLHSCNHTYIYGREDLHTAVDLNYHSLLQMEIEGIVRNTYMETIIIGDTNTGKNEVAERLSKLYGSGMVLDSASTTKAGLIAATDKSGYFGWGAFVQQHGKQLTLDEGKNLQHILPQLRCVREGKADYATAYAKRQTVAMVRFILMANDPGGALNENAYPVCSLPALIEAEADISRFTCAYFMRHEDVDMAILNGKIPDRIKSAITQDDYRIRLANAWSRTTKDIEMDEEAHNMLFKCVGELVEKYSSKIPLIQPSVMKRKLASHAGALAALQYHMSKDGKTLLVNSAYVAAACALLCKHYDSEACQYDVYSEEERMKSTIANVSEIDDLMEAERIEGKGSIMHCLKYLLSQRFLDKHHISDAFYICEVPAQLTRTIKTLIVNRCLERSSRLYKKTKAFTNYLRAKVEKEESNGEQEA